MRIGLVVDSSCDLPREFIERHGIVVMPITVEVDGRRIVDTRDETQTRGFYAERLATRSDARTLPCTAEEIEHLIVSRVARDYDYAFCVTIASSRSPIHANAKVALSEVLSKHKAPRRENGHAAPFTMRVVDSQNAFAAEALVAAAAVRHIAAGDSVPLVRDHLLALVPQVHGYMLPRDLHHLRMRARSRGDRSVSWLAAQLGNALDIKPLIKGYRNQTFACAKLRNFETGAERLFRYAARRVERGLALPVVTACYAGELKELQSLPGYRHLHATCVKHHVDLLPAMMSMSGASNVGEGALGLALADGEHEFDG